MIAFPAAGAYFNHESHKGAAHELDHQLRPSPDQFDLFAS
jgi:hypothetical protein